MTYRNRKIENTVLEFLYPLPSDFLVFPFNPMKTISIMQNCVVHSYQECSIKWNKSFDDIAEFCQSKTGCTHNYYNNFIIMYNDCPSISNGRKVFTLAHELGHILLGHFNNAGYRYIAQNETINKLLEREANHFAAMLLCPLPVVYKLKPTSILEIQKIFGLSREAAEISWRDYESYNRNYNIAWHNEMLAVYKNFLSSRA